MRNSIYHIHQKWFPALIIFAAFNTLCGESTNQVSNSAEAWAMVPEILARIIPPTFPDRDFNVLDFGATPDGEVDSVQAFRAAIQACHLAGGGRIVVPAGDYLLNGPLHLESNINLHLKEGSTLRFGANPEYYLVGDPKVKGCVLVRWEGVWCYNYSPLIYAWGKENIAITGKGTIDGQTDKFWADWYARKLHAGDRIILYQMALDMTPLEERIFGPGHHLAAGTIEFYHCKNILIEGITTRMPLERTIHPTFCENVTIRNVTIQPGMPPPVRNDDGIDPDSCRDVLIEGCTFHNYDDAIGLKSGRAREGWPENGGRPTENVIIRNCVFNGEHNGVSTGSDMSGGIRNIFVYDCRFGVANAQMYVFNAKSNADRGGVVEKIYFRNIQVGTCDQLVRMETDYKNVKYDPEKHPFAPTFRDMWFENIVCEQVLETAISMEGLEHTPIQNIHFRNITVKRAENGIHTQFTDGITWENVNISGVPIRNID